ncbi:MAG: hypothetical protein BWY09_02000 [Candidatus Hydrogenedentes bacterium ADurb.Bin179]|nr:MAG: hypothetical protein BWY09_02000 [Candidatus Hydrogenedentes bacterium ADurb.Bin179]
MAISPPLKALWFTVLYLLPAASLPVNNANMGELFIIVSNRVLANASAFSPVSVTYSTGPGWVVMMYVNADCRMIVLPDCTGP